MPPSLLQFSMYLVTSWASKLFAVEGNKPIWPPNWGPDGWLSLFPILSSFVTLQSNSHGNTIPSWRSTSRPFSSTARLQLSIYGAGWNPAKERNTCVEASVKCFSLSLSFWLVGVPDHRKHTVKECPTTCCFRIKSWGSWFVNPKKIMQTLSDHLS